MIEITPSKRQRLLSFPLTCIDFFAGIGAWELAGAIAVNKYQIQKMAALCHTN